MEKITEQMIRKIKGMAQILAIEFIDLWHEHSLINGKPNFDKADAFKASEESKSIIENMKNKMIETFPVLNKNDIIFQFQCYVGNEPIAETSMIGDWNQILYKNFPFESCIAIEIVVNLPDRNKKIFAAGHGMKLFHNDISQNFSKLSGYIQGAFESYIKDRIRDNLPENYMYILKANTTEFERKFNELLSTSFANLFIIPSLAKISPETLKQNLIEQFPILENMSVDFYFYTQKFGVVNYIIILLVINDGEWCAKHEIPLCPKDNYYTFKRDYFLGEYRYYYYHTIEGEQ